MVTSMLAFAVNDAVLKTLTGVLPVFQTLSLRGGVTALLLGLLVLYKGWALEPLSRRDKWLMAGRTLSEIGAAYFIITAIFNMKLANMTAILQILPLTVPLAAYLFLGDRLGWQRMLAIGVGFLGMLLIVQPGGDGFNIYSLYCLGAVACVTARDITARGLSQKVSSQLMAFFTSLGVFTFASIATLFETWQPVTATAWLSIMGSAIAIFFGYLVSVMAIRIGDVSYTAQFRYTGLVAALIIGYWFFDEWPNGLTIIGALVVVATGLFALYRERATASP